MVAIEVEKDEKEEVVDTLVWIVYIPLCLCLNRDEFQENLKGRVWVIRVWVGKQPMSPKPAELREKGRMEADTDGGMIAGLPGKGGEEKGPGGGGAKSKPT